jgi:hypothetical protein
MPRAINNRLSKRLILQGSYHARPGATRHSGLKGLFLLARRGSITHRAVLHSRTPSRHGDDGDGAPAPP